MIIVKNKYIPFGRFDYISIWPFIFVKKEMPEVNENHERIHGEQQKELFFLSLLIMIICKVAWYVLPLSYLVYYVFYAINWLVEVVKIPFTGDKKAYKDILFEREAFEGQEYSKYLIVRKPFAWLRLIRKKN